MGHVYALLSAVPGKERELLERLEKIPGVVRRELLFGEQVAVCLEERQLAEAPALADLSEVREARVYHDHDAWIVKHRPARNT